MGIVANGFSYRSTGVKVYGATQVNNAYPSAHVGNLSMPGNTRNITAGEAITSGLVSIPSGYRHPYCWMMPQKAGALAARNALTGEGSVTASALSVKLALADLTGSGDVTAIGSLIVQALADLTGDGTITDANLQAFLSALADLSGSGGISDAEASGLGAILAAISGSGTAAASVLTALGELDADITITGAGLSTANVGTAVWTYLIEGGLTAEQIQRVLLAFAAGDATGLEDGSPSFKAQDGSTTRIDGTYAAGTRTVTTVNGE